MFNSISGTVTQKNPGDKTASLYVDCNGIEWDFAIAKSALDSFPHIGCEVKVFTWLQHKEDVMKLYGFATETERSVFLDLTTVEGVGPAAALKIMSNISADELAAALDSEDTSRLEKAAGKKTAQKMMLKLKGKIVRFADDAVHSQIEKTEFDDIVDALSNMGFDRKSAMATVTECARLLRAADPSVTKDVLEQNVFREAIVRLS